ncbi:MAG: hypothetical protein A2Z72_08710 [Omnitrophica bacterium RBG_13_46_9]|nr:MAG: hypothetical protein A2Z72_08710 [Omnitrophica bacterium RBG_13_46_9]
MNILFASSEVAPFAKTGGLGDVSASLPKALNEIGCSLSVIMPFYKSVKNLGLNLTPFTIEGFNFLSTYAGGEPLSTRQAGALGARHGADDINYVFVVNDEYYDRDNLYSDGNGEYKDNGLRFSYFSRAVLSFAINSDFKPDIIHCNDWHAGLVCLYAKLRNTGIETLFTIHNIGYQGLFPKALFDKLCIPRRFFKVNDILHHGKISFLKAGIIHSSAISTVSNGYRKEILTPAFGCGMDAILRRHASRIYGIVNGVDYSEWDPKTDKRIACNYGPENIDRKTGCKKDLIESTGLPPETMERPVVGMISRLAYQKGVDLIAGTAKDIIDLGASIVILGIGDDKYNNLFKDIAGRHPGYISSHIVFDDSLAHKIEAGSDIFVMPSRYEPCGLNQLYSLRYGTLPVVRATGGLDDTIIDLYADKERGNGIKFSGATKKDLIEAIARAVELYKNKELWQDVTKRIMNLDFSWRTSALQYKRLYEKMLNSPR